MGMNLKEPRTIASLFDLPSPIEVFDFPEKGNINRETYLVTAGALRVCSEYILQKLNPGVFKRPSEVMRAMILCIEAQRKAISEGALLKDEEWETIRLIPTREGEPFLDTVDEEGPCCWRMMARIVQTRSYKSLQQIAGSRDRLQAAEETGRGLALFGNLTAALDPLHFGCPLPGYRNTGLYYDQLHSVLAGNRTPTEAISYLPVDPELRESTEDNFLVRIEPGEYRRRLDDPAVRRSIDLSLEHESCALKLAEGLKSGYLRTAVIHGDTKIENFLFSARTGRAIALVDLDTIMPHTWLSDWGDMARSLINPAGEKEKDLAKVTADLEIFESAARGLLSTARHTTEQEVALMADAVQIMSLELGTRFLTDYLRGDTYFRLGSADETDLNKTRALVQFRLFEDVCAKTGRIKSILSDCSKRITGLTR